MAQRIAPEQIALRARQLQVGHRLLAQVRQHGQHRRLDGAKLLWLSGGVDPKVTVSGKRRVEG